MRSLTALSAFLDVSSLNLAVPPGTAFLFGSQSWIPARYVARSLQLSAGAVNGYLSRARRAGLPGRCRTISMAVPPTI